MERRIVASEASLLVRLLQPLSVEVKTVSCGSHTSELMLLLSNSSELRLRFHQVLLSEGSVRYSGPAGVQAVSLGELFAVQITEQREAALEAGDALAVALRLRPRPQAFVQLREKSCLFVLVFYCCLDRFTDREGSFSGRAVASWSVPGVVRGPVASRCERQSG